MIPPATASPMGFTGIPETWVPAPEIL